MLKNVAVVVLALVLLLCVYIFTRPDTFRIERSTTIAAAADIPFAFVNDFHQWNRWSPFDKLDSNMKRTFSGPPAGVGSGYAWSGNSDAGVGSMNIRESAPNEHIAIAMEFEKPFKSSSVAEFAFTPTAGGTNVSWTMSGPNTILGKAISVFASLDKMLGPQFTEGLATLKNISEAEAKRRASMLAPVADTTSTVKR